MATEAAEVMASVDEASGEFVIADISREDAWLSVGRTESAPLSEWR